MQNTQGNIAQSPPDGFVRCCHKGARLDVDADWDVVKNTISIE